MRITNTAIAALEVNDKPIYDDLVPGFHVKANKRTKTFNLYFRTKTGRERRPKIGDCDVLTIAQAREIARELLAEVAKGGDPIADRYTAKMAPTMNDLWVECQRRHWHRGTAWDQEVRRLYDVHIKPRIGSYRVCELQYPEIDGIRTALAATPNQANRAISVVSKMLNTAERLQWRAINTNPCARIERYPELKRARFAKPAEIAVIGPILERKLAEAERLGGRNTAKRVSGVAFLYLLMFSGARPSEIENGTPDQLERVERDGEVFGVLRLPRGKNGDARKVFLPPQAMQVIDRLPAKRATLANRKKLPTYLWRQVREEAGCKDLWARDWRRTFATVGLSGGQAIGIVAELLGQRSTQTTKIYAKLMEDPAMNAAADIASRMEKFLGAPP